MPNYKPIRLQRYEKLRRSGFTKLEARTLSKIPENTPYVKIMRQARAKDLKLAIKKGLTEAQYDKLILDLYKQKGWSQIGLNADIPVHKMDVRAVYKMLREYEDKYKDDQGMQNFKSPWVKKQKQFTDFSNKFDKTVQVFRD